MTLEQLQNRRAEIQNEIEVLNSRKQKIDREIRRIESYEYIKANSIEKDDVWDVESHAVYFPQSSHLWDYLVANPVKEKYVTWNGRLHLTRDMASGAFKPTPARYEDLE